DDLDPHAGLRAGPDGERAGQRPGQGGLPHRFDGHPGHQGAAQHPQPPRRRARHQGDRGHARGRGRHAVRGRQGPRHPRHRLRRAGQCSEGPRRALRGLRDHPAQPQPQEGAVQHGRRVHAVGRGTDRAVAGAGALRVHQAL
ncbi:MAG: hypothetical protein AVDCRST_MAG51-664, partial [uncultured Ramlibacter sp.]